MILSNTELHKALDSGRLIIKPDPHPRKPSQGVACPYGTHTVDLTLAPDLSIPSDGTFVLDLTEPGKIADFIARNSTKLKISRTSPHKLQPRQFLLAQTAETVGLPIRPRSRTCLAARIEGKSSFARCGLLVHFTAPTVHPGWHGPLTLEVINLGPAAVNLVPGVSIAQLIVEEVKGVPVENPSQFRNQKTPEGTA